MAAEVVAAQQRLVRAEVADVVPRPEHDAERVAALLEGGEAREELEQLVGLDQELGLVGGAAHRHGELDLPAAHAEGGDGLEDVAEHRRRRGG